MTNPKKILPLIKFASSALELGLITKDEVIDWADKIVTEEDIPDIFFIDLSLSSSKDRYFVLSYLHYMLAFEAVEACGRPLLSLLHKWFKNGKYNLPQTIMILSSVKYHGSLTIEETNWVYDLEEQWDYDTIENVHKALTAFLSIYEGYSLFNYEGWPEIDKTIEAKLSLLKFDS
jgi:hypothetical protein